MRPIDGDALKRRAKKVATESWKMKIEAKVETVLNQFIDWINEAPTIQPEPHWISCSEKLPKTGQDVELCCGYKIFSGEMVRYICIAFHVNQYEMKADENWDEGCDEYREEDDEFYVSEGWYERIHNWDDYGSVKIYDEALAWRELPEEYRGE